MSTTKYTILWNSNMVHHQISNTVVTRWCSSSVIVWAILIPNPKSGCPIWNSITFEERQGVKTDSAFVGQSKSYKTSKRLKRRQVMMGWLDAISYGFCFLSNMLRAFCNSQAINPFARTLLYRCPHDSPDTRTSNTNEQPQ